MIYVLYVIKFTRSQLKDQLALSVEDVFKFLKNYMLKILYNSLASNTPTSTTKDKEPPG